MKKMLALILLLGSIGFQNQDICAQKVMVLTNFRHGFFSLFLGVLGNLDYCDKNGLIPVVQWGSECNYYQKDGYNGSTEPWEYYFEPISDISYEEAIQMDGTIIHDDYSAPDGTSIPITKCKKRNKTYKKILDKEYRSSIYNLMKKYIKIKPSIRKKIDTFYDSYIEGKPTIGIHIRGTDKHREVKQISVERICDEANELAKQSSDCQFFIATDDARLLKKVKSLLNGPVISYDSYRSTNGKPIHKRRQRYSKAKLGEEVLIEVSLLARCDKFVHTRSSVSSAVLLFNPELDNMLLYDKKRCPLRRKKID